MAKLSELMRNKIPAASFGLPGLSGAKPVAKARVVPQGPMPAVERKAMFAKSRKPK